MRLIDADVLIKTLGIGDLPIRLTYEIENAPTVDAVPVIRCKDCRFFKERFLSVAGNKVPAHWCEEWYGNTRESGFCHLAERREE